MGWFGRLVWKWCTSAPASWPEPDHTSLHRGWERSLELGGGGGSANALILLRWTGLIF